MRADRLSRLINSMRRAFSARIVPRSSLNLFKRIDTRRWSSRQEEAESNQQVKEAGSFPDIPLTVIAATDHGPFFKDWEPTLMGLQRQLATLSPPTTFIVAQGSGHDVQIDRPELVIDAIRRMARSHH